MPLPFASFGRWTDYFLHSLLCEKANSSANIATLSTYTVSKKLKLTSGNSTISTDLTRAYQVSTRHQASHGALGSVRWEGNVRSLWIKDRVPAPVPTYRPGELRQVISPYTSIFLPVKQRQWYECTLYTVECCAFNCTSTTGFDKLLLHHRNHWGCLRGGPPPCSVASGVGFHMTAHWYFALSWKETAALQRPCREGRTGCRCQEAPEYSEVGLLLAPGKGQAKKRVWGGWAPTSWRRKARIA